MPRAFHLPSSLVIVVLLLAAAFAALGLTPQQQRRDQPGSSKATGPKLVISSSFMPGMVPPGRDDSSAGVLLAVWDDGLVVFPMNSRKAGADLQVGRITPEQAQAVLKELHTSDFFEQLPGGGAIPDAASYTLFASRESKSARYTCWWTDPSRASLNVDSDAAARRFAKVWTLSRTAIEFAKPSKYSALANDKEALRRYERAKAAGEFR